MNNFSDNENFENVSSIKHKPNFIEFIELEDFIYSAINTYNKNRESEIRFSKIASKIAHDIRSPIASLNSLVKNIPNLNSEHIRSIHQLITRINDTSNNLLKEYKAVNENNLTKPENIFLITDQIVSEKKLQFANKNNISIELLCEDNAILLCSRVNVINFNIMLSNLINNAFESIDENKNGIIKVKIEKDNNSICLKIIDNGHGINNELIPRIINGFSIGKNGTGFGISTSIEFIRSWDGTFNILSEKNIGTTIVVKIPISEPPKWLKTEIKIYAEHTIQVLDDDPNTNDILISKFKNMNFKFYSSADEFMLYVNNTCKNKNNIYLIDYDLNMPNTNGLNIIKKLCIQESSAIITNRFNDRQLQEECILNEIQIIPKNILSKIEIKIDEEKHNSDFKIVISIIDDEIEVINSWKEKLGVEDVFYFNHPDDFILAFSDDERINKTTLIITDFYFNNECFTNIIDLVMLKDVLKFNGKIFLFSNATLDNSGRSLFDYVFNNKTMFYTKKYLYDLFLKTIKS